MAKMMRSTLWTLAKKTVACFAAFAMVSFRFAKLRTEPVSPAGSPRATPRLAGGGGAGSQNAEGRRVKAGGRSLKSKVEVRRSGHGQDAPARRPRCAGLGRRLPVLRGAIRRLSLKAGVPRLGGPAGAEKKECLFLTNEAIMLLKTKDRQNERSQTKPIKATKLLKTRRTGARD
jgi:hypothetical protein